MRVIAGRAKGHRLKGPRGRSQITRPSSDRLREAVFSALTAMGADMTRVLDLYAGSGALGIEALSRGAGWCDFVEREAVACVVIRENLRITGFEGQARVHRVPVERAIERLGGVYTLVLADPPYADTMALSVLERLAESPLVEAGSSVLMFEGSARGEPPAQLGRLSLASVRRYGDSMVSIYR